MVEILERREIMQSSVYVFASDNNISWRIKRRKSYENVQIGDENSDKLRIEGNKLTVFSIVWNIGEIFGEYEIWRIKRNGELSGWRIIRKILYLKPAVVIHRILSFHRIHRNYLDSYSVYTLWCFFYRIYEPETTKITSVHCTRTCTCITDIEYNTG